MTIHSDEPASTTDRISPAASRKPRLIPANADTLNVWRHMEYDLLRIIAGWGRQAEDWEDKLAVCYHVWLQAEIVAKLRDRLAMFPPHKPELPAAGEYEQFSNTVLLAPTFSDAMEAAHGILNPALTQAYRSYLASSHPVHDKPTHDLLSEILAFKRKQSDWFEDFQQRHEGMNSEGTSSDYRSAVQARMLPLRGFVEALSPVGEPARIVGKDTDFLMPQTPGRVPHWNEAPNIMPLLEVDWGTSVEARRLFFMIAYCWEMGVAETQLRWIYYADFMPFEFIHEEARHMWDESRHGDSGLARLRDFGLDIADVGYSSYGARGEGFLPPLTPSALYDDFFFITQVAERGYFKTKTYCFEDFAAGGDPASAEMMQYDIIDETSHAEYGRKWLSEMAARAGVEEDWLQRGAREREQKQSDSDARVAGYRRFVADGQPEANLIIAGVPVSVTPKGDHRILLDAAARAHYERLLNLLRDKCPLANATTAPARPNLPM